MQQHFLSDLDRQVLSAETLGYTAGICREGIQMLTGRIDAEYRNRTGTADKRKSDLCKGYRKRALMLASVASMIDQFNMNNIKLLQNLGYEIDVAANFVDSGTITAKRVRELKKELHHMHVNIFHVPIPRDITRFYLIWNSYQKIEQLCNGRKYDLIHCHSPIGGVIARAAARNRRRENTKVIYTAHGFHFYHGAPVKNWLLFYPAEWICSWWTDVLITINKEDYRLAKKMLHAKKTVYIPGVGIDMAGFCAGASDTGKTRAGLGVRDEDMMLLSVGELSKRKNHETVIRALHELNNPRAKYFICGKGRLQSYLLKLVSDLDMDGQVRLLGYRTDISQLCQAADLFILPSHQEGVSVALMEAIACRVPAACSKIRGNVDLADDYLFDQNDVQNLTELLKSIVTTRKHLHEVMEKSVQKNYERLQAFDLSHVMKKMRKLYETM